jgi:hypothetical protein
MPGFQLVAQVPTGFRDDFNAALEPCPLPNTVGARCWPSVDEFQIFALLTIRAICYMIAG